MSDLEWFCLNSPSIALKYVSISAFSIFPSSTRGS
jgi:hypothetical protein